MKMVVLTSFVSDGVAYTEGDVVDLDEKFLVTGFVVKSVAERSTSAVEAGSVLTDESAEVAQKLVTMIDSVENKPKFPSLPPVKKF